MALGTPGQAGRVLPSPYSGPRRAVSLVSQLQTGRHGAGSPGATPHVLPGALGEWNPAPGVVHRHRVQTHPEQCWRWGLTDGVLHLHTWTSSEFFFFFFSKISAYLLRPSVFKMRKISALIWSLPSGLGIILFASKLQGVILSSFDSSYKQCSMRP